MVPEMVLSAMAGVVAGGAYVFRRVKPELQDLDRRRALEALRSAKAEDSEYVAKILDKCIACHWDKFAIKSCACSRPGAHIHMGCSNCSYHWIIDPLDPNAK